jgi:triphosphoribosyl-dephospho-CoA synthetase
LKALEIYKNCVLTKKSFGPGSEKPSLLTLAYIGANLNDSNIIARAGVKGLEYSMKKFESAYYSGLENPKNLPFLMESLDIDFSGRRISPGGAADIFALTCFLFMLEKSGPEFAVFVL